jgi:cell wall-associated NlpC family hydrolase
MKSFRIFCLPFALSMLSACAQWLEPGEAVATPTATQSALGERVVKLVQQQIGAPYVYGGNTPRGFDCSGLVEYVYGEADIRLPRTAEGQFNSTPRVALAALRPGDIVFFRSDSGNLMHVGIYIGSHWFVHAPDSGKAVEAARLDSAYWKGHYLGAGRPGG